MVQLSSRIETIAAVAATEMVKKCSELVHKYPHYSAGFGGVIAVCGLGHLMWRFQQWLSRPVIVTPEKAEDTVLKPDSRSSTCEVIPFCIKFAGISLSLLGIGLALALVYLADMYNPKGHMIEFCVGAALETAGLIAWCSASWDKKGIELDWDDNNKCFFAGACILSGLFLWWLP